MVMTTSQPTAMSEQTASNIAARMIQPTGDAPCAGCGEMVETATVLGRTVYACDDCGGVGFFENWKLLKLEKHLAEREKLRTV
jgi:hypothetical protein